MPQMSPLLWLNLYFMFTALLIFFMVTLFFIKPYSTAPSASPTRPKQKLNWKW